MNKVAEINKINNAFAKAMEQPKRKNPIKRFFQKIKWYFKVRLVYSYLYESVLNNIKQRTWESEVAYRYFRLLHSKYKRIYENI